MHTQTLSPATMGMAPNHLRTDDGAAWMYTTDTRIPTYRSWRAFFANELRTRHRMELAEIVDLALDAWICWAAVCNTLDGMVRLLAFPLAVCLPGTPLDRAGYTYGYQVFDEQDVVALAAVDGAWRRCPPRILAQLTPALPHDDCRVAAWRELSHLYDQAHTKPHRREVLAHQVAALVAVVCTPAAALPAADVVGERVSPIQTARDV